MEYGSVPPTDILRLLFEQAHVQGSRSTVLNPLGWALAILLSTLVGCQFAHAERWISIALGIGSGVTLCMYLAAYVYFAIRDPDALRSERYSLSKLAIERSRTGDDRSGFGDEPDAPSLPAGVKSAEPTSLEGPR